MNYNYHMIIRVNAGSDLQQLLLKLLGYELQPLTTLSLHYRRGNINIFVNSSGHLFRHYG
jgi:hypothetical protein